MISGWFFFFEIRFIHLFFHFLFPYEACNNFLILTTPLISGGSVSVEQHRAVYRTPASHIATFHLFSKVMDGERLKCVQGECALPALLLGKGLSERGTVIARNLLSTLTHSARFPFSDTKRNCKRIVTWKIRFRNDQKFFYWNFPHSRHLKREQNSIILKNKKHIVPEYRRPRD